MQSLSPGLPTIADTTGSMDFFSFHYEQSKTLFTFVNHASIFDHHPDLFIRSAYLASYSFTITANLYSDGFKANLTSKIQTWLCLANLSPHHYLVTSRMAFINSFSRWTHFLPNITIWRRWFEIAYASKKLQGIRKTSSREKYCQQLLW